jgi:hypothetical protein
MKKSLSLTRRIWCHVPYVMPATVLSPKPTHESDPSSLRAERRENTQVPDDAEARVSPHEPMQQHRFHKSRHGHSRRSAARRRLFRRFPTISRLNPDESRSFPDCPGPCACRRIPTFPDHFPTATRLAMLQLLPGPGDSVHIHPVMWLSMTGVPQEAGN